MDIAFDTLRPFAFHGVDFVEMPKPPAKDSKPKGQARGYCPFCKHKNPKLYINVANGLWDCKHCGKGSKANGNTIGFLSEIHAAALAATTDAHYDELAADRYGIPAKMFKEDEVARDELFSSPRWLIPMRDIRGKLVNLQVWQPGKEPMFTAGIPLTLGGLEHLRGGGPAQICEGYWDRLALERLRRAAQKKCSVLNTTSAHVFKADWCNLFAGRDVGFFYDNDSPGYEGSRAAAYKVKGHCTGAYVLDWPTNTPDKWDIRDYVHKALDKDKADPKEAWADLMSMLNLTEGSDADISNTIINTAKEFPRRRNFSAVLTDFKRAYHIDRKMEDALLLMFGTVLSVQLHGDPLWLFIVGPPGGGKTLLLRAFEKSPFCIFKSAITPKSLVSGFDPGGGHDPSLIPLLTGKALVLKDYTEVMTLSREVQEEMYGILRGAYDGHVERHYGNGMVRDFPNCYFAMLAGVTDRIHGDERASLGERFLKYQMIEGEDYNPQKHIETALRSMAGQKEMDELVREVVAGFTLKHDLTTSGLKLPVVPSWCEKRIIALSQIVAHLRADVQRVGRDELAYRPTPEVGTRLAKQLKKLAQCIAVVLDLKAVDKRIHALIEQVAFDTARGWSLDVLHAVMKYHPKPTYAEVIELQARIPKSTCARRLENLIAIGALIRTKAGKVDPKTALPTRGQPAYGYAASPTLTRLWKDASIGSASKGK